MFKPSKKSLYYALMFPSLFAVFLATPSKDGKSTTRSFSCSYPGIHHQLLSEKDPGEAELGPSPICLAINCYTHKQKYFVTGIIWPVFFQKMYPHSLSVSSDKVCMGMARFFQESGSSSAYSYQASHQLLQKFNNRHKCTKDWEVLRGL